MEIYSLSLGKGSEDNVAHLISNGSYSMLSTAHLLVLLQISPL